MMGALADIQTKGDSMLAGIRWQKDMLDRLEKNLKNTEKKMKEAEFTTKKLEDEKIRLSSEVLKLEGIKDLLVLKMKEEEEDIIRVKADLGPLKTLVATRKSELINYKSSLATKKYDLQNYQKQVDDATKSLSSLKTSESAASESSTPVLVVLTASLLINVIAGLQLATGLLSGQRSEG